jgi:phosphoribosylaminoimidazolecarboxamide formyltransferase/IMP cyclohydrolase
VCPLEAARPVRLRSAVAGVLVERRDDLLLKDDLKMVSGEPPDETVLNDLVFAWKAVKHVKSNAIVFAGRGRTLGIGAGQPSRVDSTRLAITKAAQFGHDLRGSVMASDGFFPFPDSVELAAQAGAQAVVQPGGSIRDGEVIEAAKRLGLTMALTSVRHFRH